MKKTIFIILLALISIQIKAQKAKARAIEMYYYHLPAQPLSLDIKTYGLIVNNLSSRVDLPEFQTSTYLKIEGFEKVEPADADLIIEFTLSGVQTTVNVRTKEVEKKVDDKTIKETKYYYYIGSKPTAKLGIKSKNGSITKSINYSGDKYLYETISDLYNTKKEATDAINKKKKALIENTDNTAIENILKTIYSYLNNNYGYYSETNTEFIYTGKGKKHDYSDLDELVELYKKAADEYNANKKITPLFTELSTTCITGWKKVIKEYEPKNKKARISPKNIKYLYHNIVIAYLYLNDFDNAISALEASKSTVKYTASIDELIKAVKERERRYNLNEQRKAGKL